MKHRSVDDKTDLKVGDFVWYNGHWNEIYHISENNGIHLSYSSWVCRTKLYKDKLVDSFDYSI